MKVYSRICIKNYTLTAHNGDTFTAERGKEYTTSASNEKTGCVTVFSGYWVPVPIEYFAGTLPL